MDISIPQEGNVQATWNLIAKDTLEGSSSSIAGTPVYTNEGASTGYDAYVSINGMASRPIQTANMTITNNMDESGFVIQKRVREEIAEGRREATGSITALFRDLSEYQIFRREEKVPVVISFNLKGQYCEFEFPEVKLTGSGTPQISGPGLIQASYNFSAFQQDAAYDVRFRMVTTESALR